MKHSRLIRGVIYDNPNVVEEKTFETAETLSIIADDAGAYYDKVLSECDCPNKDEFMISVAISAICHPSPEEENMIIPSSLVDDRLYNHLKKINIGEDLCDSFIILREEKFLDECEAKGITTRPMFESDEEKVDYIERTSGIKPTLRPNKMKLNIVA